MAIRQHPSSTVQRYNLAVDYGALAVLGVRVRMWRLVKRVSQLLVIAFGFWSGVQGMLTPGIAFAGMILVYLGVEGFEMFLAAVGSEGLSVSIESGADDDNTEQTRWETDGGTVPERCDALGGERDGK